MITTKCERCGKQHPTTDDSEFFCDDCVRAIDQEIEDAGGGIAVVRAVCERMDAEHTRGYDPERKPSGKWGRG